MKTCKKCGSTEFVSNGKGRTRCKPCRTIRLKRKKSEYDKKYGKQHYVRVKKRAEQRARYTTKEGKLRMMLNSTKCRAKKKGIPFNLDAPWMTEHWNGGACEVTGLEYILNVPAKWITGNYAPSIDRIDPAGGYTKNNCRLVVWMFNSAKGVGTDKDILKLAEALCKT